MSRRFANSDEGGEYFGWRVGLSGASSRLAYGLGWCVSLYIYIALGKAGLAARCHEEEEGYVVPLRNRIRSRQFVVHISSCQFAVASL